MTNQEAIAILVECAAKYHLGEDTEKYCLAVAYIAIELGKSQESERTLNGR